MAKVWVKAKSIVRTSENGQIMTYHPGDWCMMGKQQARDCLSRNEVEILKPAVLQSVQDLTDCAIYYTGSGLSGIQVGLLAAKFPAVPIRQWDSYPAEGRFLLWDTSANLNRDKILVGFKLLEYWQLAVPLCDYSVLAQSVGTAKERQETEAIIHDLRVPVYDCRVLFVRNCTETKRLFDLWDGSQLGFLQALYQSRPVVNALPPIWVLK